MRYLREIFIFKYNAIPPTYMFMKQTHYSSILYLLVGHRCHSFNIHWRHYSQTRVLMTSRKQSKCITPNLHLLSTQVRFTIIDFKPLIKISSYLSKRFYHQNYKNATIKILTWASDEHIFLYGRKTSVLFFLASWIIKSLKFALDD